MQKQLPQAWAPKWQRFLVAFFAAGLIYQLGHLLFGVRIELFWGVAGYDLAWVATMFVLPVVTGIAIGFIYGWGGKLVAHFPPLIILGIDYYSMMHGTVPEGAKLIPLMWWGFFVILNMEFCAAGGVIGELLLKKHYGTWDLPGTSDYAPADSEIIPRDDGK
ncbi:MAG: hypothetical protein Q9M17_08745 [Mariprofundus sp.]|nr:hypothetical protein [Mariprofundus sp.]